MALFVRTVYANRVRMSRKRSPHPGIVVIPANPAARRAASIRFKDPDTGRPTTTKIPAELEGPTLLRWLKKQSLALQQRKLQSVPPPGQLYGLSVDRAIDQYLDECKRLEPATQDSYARSANLIQRCPVLPAITSQWTLAHLTALRSWLDRDAVRATSVNHHLRHVHAMLGYWRRAGLVPRLSKDEIAEGLKQLTARPQRPVALTRPQIRQLVLSLREDGERHASAEFRRYVLLLLLGGPRAGEALKFRRSFLEPERVRVPAEITKTHRTRFLDDYISPGLRAELERAPEDRMFPFGHQAALEWRFKLGLPFPWDFQQLRQTCGSYLANAGGIARSASVQVAAQRLGHDVKTAEKYYLDQVIVSRDARTLEEAMGVADLLDQQPRQQNPDGQR